MELFVFTPKQRGLVDSVDPEGLPQKAILVEKEGRKILVVGWHNYHRDTIRFFLNHLGVQLDPIGPNEDLYLQGQMTRQGYKTLGGCDIYTDGFTTPPKMKVFGKSLSFGEMSEQTLQTVALRIGATYKK